MKGMSVTIAETGKELVDVTLEKRVTALILDNALAHQTISSQLENFAATLERIEKQTTATNGHVTKLRLWRSAIVAAIIILIPILILLGNTVITNTGIIKKFEQLHMGQVEASPSVIIKP